MYSRREVHSNDGTFLTGEEVMVLLEAIGLFICWILAVQD